jgi:oxaloacetate decarboxylase alpha subunit
VKRVLIANRGEIAVRVIRACRRLGLETVAVHSEADRQSRAATLADRAVCIGPAPAGASYLNASAILASARGTGADALHPGYGFLAENGDFAAACRDAGLVWVGPPPAVIRLMGDKARARAAAAAAGLPVVPGAGPLATVEAAVEAGRWLGYPLLLKAVAGGGGRGLRAVRAAGDLPAAFAGASAEARAAFGDGTLYIERLLEGVRHVEIQVLADRAGAAIHLGERDCSVQRRHQKLLEEAPSPALGPALRAAMGEAALALVRSVRYENAGTVEFLVDPGSGAFFFIEMNTRIQVEHPVTEMLTGVDLVVEQLRLAAGQPLHRSQEDVRLDGHALECRINAEDPARGFQPSPGVVREWVVPAGEGVRVDSHVVRGSVIPPHYDSLLAKLVVAGPDRETALARARRALDAFHVDGVATTIPFHRLVLDHPDFVTARVHTRWVDEEARRTARPAGARPVTRSAGRITLIDTTLRDAHQSLWSTRMTTAMMLPVAAHLDRAGFEAIDLVGGAVFDVCVRYLREDPWERMRLMSRAITRTPLIVMTRGQSLFTFEFFPDDVVELTAQRIAANGVRYVTPYDALNDIRNLEVPVRASRAAGLHVAAGLVYTVSPVHTDAYYAARARELVALGVDAVFLKDPSGLLTPERVRTLVPALRGAVGAVRLQLHTHCLTGLGPLCALEAIRHGIDTVHTATSVLAHGASQPPTEWVARQARRLGYEVDVDPEALAPVADHFRAVAAREGKPLGRIAEYDPFHYQHQVPGGMISNLRVQLRELGLEPRLDEILEEAARVRQDLGYPIVVSPFAQFVVTQAVLNVVQGERYRTVPDEVRKYALGHYGALAAPVAPDILDRVAGRGRPVTARPGELLAPGLDRVRRDRGPFASDDDLLLAVFYDDARLRSLVAARPIPTGGPWLAASLARAEVPA